jgi:hypothetical protein
MLSSNHLRIRKVFATAGKRGKQLGNEIAAVCRA